MICPTCGTHIPDGSMRCPACHAGVGMTVAMPALRGRWCPSCGSGVSWDDEVCPNCGLPLEREWGAPSSKLADPGDKAADVAPSAQPVVDETADTRAIPRIESAIPAEDDPTSKVAKLEGMPRVSRLMLASFAAVMMVCGLALAITHPWNPDAYSIRATEEADTSMAGFPGTVESLSGQDNGGGSHGEVLTGDEATYRLLIEAYERLARYAARADESEATFSDAAFDPDKEAREKGKHEAEALAIDVSNLISDITDVDVTSGSYVEEREHLITLGNWLRNRVDTLCEAWRAAARSQDLEADRAQIEALLAADDGGDGKSTYKTLFDESYDEWKPEQKGNE